MTELSQAAALSAETYSGVPITLLPMSELFTPAEPPTSRYDEILREQRAAEEAEYIAQLQADGKPIYTREQVAEKFGIVLDPAWTQEDLQNRMAAGDVLYPARSLRVKARDVHTKFVNRGREALRAILQDTYRLYVRAERSENSEIIYAQLKREIDKKHRTDSSNASVLVRMVFTDSDDKQVHVASRALEYGFFKNVAADGFAEWVEKFAGGLEGIRKAASKELPKTQKQS